MSWIKMTHVIRYIA